MKTQQKTISPQCHMPSEKTELDEEKTSVAIVKNFDTMYRFGQ